MSDIQGQIVRNYLFNNSIIYSFLKYRTPYQRFRFKGTIYSFKKEFMYILMNYVLLRQNQIVLKKKYEKKKKFDEHLKDYSKNAKDMLRESIQFHLQEKDIIKRNIRVYTESLFNENESNLIYNYFLEKYMSRYRKDIQLERIFTKIDLNKPDCIYYILNYFYEYAIKYHVFNDKMISNIKKEIMGYDI